ncbi:MAG TPA: DNA-processing protein DprA [Solirubrobacteraceae bacterium]|nr:DNA-processing protein DprA [Solirubrobacteraceae bacterium]
MRASADSIAGACAQCLRRSWLLGELSAVLDCNSRSDGRLYALLALDDAELIAALGGRRREHLRRAHAELGARELASTEGTTAICRHDPRYPAGLMHPVAPALLHVAGGRARLHALTGRPVVAFPAASRASDYGLELAYGLGRGLAASGVTIEGGRGPLAQAALAGALAAEGATLLVVGDGLGVGGAMSRRRARERLEHRGCTLAELPGRVRGRRWGENAAERIVVSLADVAIVVEAEETPRALAAPRLARELGKPLGACPGRVTSRASSGSHALLREGALLIRDASDVLEMLHATHPAARAAAGEHSDRAAEEAERVLRGLSPRLRLVLEQVGAGVDTPGKLAAGSTEAGEVLRALGELELIGLLRRGDGGRYLLSEAQRCPDLR